MTAKKRRTFWLADTVTAQHRDRALLLTQKGFDIQFFTSIDAVISELEAKRAAIIIVSDAGDEGVATKILTQLIGLPEVQGARLILARGGNSPALSVLAACANFRDIIPFDLDEKQWLSRFLFATGGKQMRLPAPPAQISMNGIAAVAFPARITWMSARRLRLECRVRPPAGAALNLHGYLAEALGVTSITLNVVETQRNLLLYRFSDAVIAEWSVPQAARPKVDLMLKDLAEQDPGPRCRIFIAVQSPSLRTAILAQFADPRFEVTTALSKASIAEEPKFFTPDVVFIESALAFEDQGVRFTQLLTNTDENTTVVLLGDDLGLAALVAAFPGRRVLRFPKLPRNLTQSIVAKYMHLSARRLAAEEPEARQILPEHPASMAEVSFPARLTRLHPSVAQLALPYPVGNFALGRVEAPALRKLVRRNPYGKLSAIYQDTHPDTGAFPHLVDMSLSDLTSEEQARVADGLIDYVRASLGFAGRETKVLPLKSAAGAEAEGRVNAAFPRPEAPTAVVVALPSVADLPPPPVIETLRLATAPAVDPAPGPSAFVAPVPKPNFVDMIRQTPAESRVPFGKREGFTAESFTTALKYIAIVAFGLGVLWGLFVGLEPHYKKDGGAYTESLKKLAPHLDKDNKNP